MTPAIPKLFHSIWLGGSDLPEQHRHWIDTWLEQHPGWTHTLWTDENRPEFVNEATFQTSDSLTQRSEIARYELVYRYGGVYLDTDMECLRPIEALLEGVDAFAVVEEGSALATCIFGAVPEHRWLGEVIERLPASVAAGWGIMHQAGPFFFTGVTRTHAEVTVFERTLFAVAGGVDVSDSERYFNHHAVRNWDEYGKAQLQAKLRELATEDVEPIVPRGEAFVLVDKGHGLDVSGGRRPIPFPERNGEWAGYPAGDAEAIAELERLRAQGARFVVFPGPMLYWLDAYPGLASYLREQSTVRVDNGRSLVFELP